MTMLEEKSGYAVSKRPLGPSSRKPQVSARGANLIDMLRLPAALCVVWYHDPIYWSLGDWTPSVDAWKLFLLGWSMPFFYATAIYFALGQKPAAAASRIARLVLLIVAFTAIYEAALARAPDSFWHVCVLGSATQVCTVDYAWTALRGVDNSPLYFLSDLLVVVAISFVTTWIPEKFRLAVLLLGALILVAVGEDTAFGLFLNPLSVGCFGVAAAGRLVDLSRSREITLLMAVVVLAAFIGVFGTLNLWVGQNAIWRNGIWPAATFGGLIVALLIGNRSLVLSGSAANWLSEIGRRYSFGIFAFHQLAFDVLQRQIQLGDPLALYLVVGVAATAASFLLTMLARKFLPALLKA